MCSHRSASIGLSTQLVIMDEPVHIHHNSNSSNFQKGKEKITSVHDITMQSIISVALVMNISLKIFFGKLNLLRNTNGSFIYKIELN